MSVQLKRGVLELCVLSRLKLKDTYGYNIYQSVNKVLEISESTIYPILRKLVQEGYLETYLQESPEGPARKCFSITSKGKTHLEKLTDEWDEFIENVEQLIMR